MYTHHITVSAETDIGLRLDAFLSAQLPDFSRNRIQALIAEGNVTNQESVPVTGRSYRVKEGDSFTVVVPEPEASEMQPADIPLHIAYEDEHLLVIDKQAGLTVHPGAGCHGDTLVNALLHHCGGSLSGIGGVSRPGIVHRLDRDTSGLMVVAKHDKAHNALAEQIATRELKRVYNAIVWGLPSPVAGKIEMNLDRSHRDRTKMTVVRQGGKIAITHYKLKETYGMLASRVECHLETGRTHQIRVHFLHKGHALVGDPSYGRRPNSKSIQSLSDEVKQQLFSFPRQALHSTSIGFYHPETGEYLTFESPVGGETSQDIGSLRDTLAGLF